jgi:hypothetical protein
MRKAASFFLITVIISVILLGLALNRSKANDMRGIDWYFDKLDDEDAFHGKESLMRNA